MRPDTCATGDEVAHALLHDAHLPGRPCVVGDRRGRTIGFPTANLTGYEGMALPADGVYATRTAVWGDLYPSVTNVGSNPTVGGDRITVETHLIGFSGDLYGAELRVSFIEKLRGEMTFTSLEALRARIEIDAKKASELLRIQ